MTRQKMHMKGLVNLFQLVLFIVIFVALSKCLKADVSEEVKGECELAKPLKPRQHSVSILEFGAVGDGKTLNTVAFQNAIFYVKSFVDKGGAQLYVPAGRWLTATFNLTSHLTLFLERDAIILGTQDYSHWEIEEPLPSYGRGIELPGRRYRGLITGYNLTDVVITGDNGTIDGQGSLWWEKFSSGSLNFSRPDLIELVECKGIVISNTTFLNAPSWTIHTVYCSEVLIQNITAYSPPYSPYTSGIVPDSSDHVCIEDSNITTGYDAIVLKSGWDEYGISYGRPTTNVHIKNMHLTSSTGSAVAIGSEMSGGISYVHAEELTIYDSFVGFSVRTSKGRGGYIQYCRVKNVVLDNVRLAIEASGQFESHPDGGYDPSALPVVNGITFENLFGNNITAAGVFLGIDGSPFTSICLSNVSLSVSDSSPWLCSDISGFSEAVSPEPCDNLKSTSTACYFREQSRNPIAVL
ncbi:probable polygalacturonase [Impatiens glandulifera]|uniref:probable polygalacturonase n=1 Tax=Impatiens glandulifera TaxID=253017 RepID=UPI001FB0F618|nr:probable polygalacturonase [Impatiens glandulifera]